MISIIVAVGGGPAGAQTVDTLRHEGFEGRLSLGLAGAAMPVAAVAQQRCRAN